MTIQAANNGHSVVLILDGDRERAALAARALTGSAHLVMTGGDAVVGALVGRRLALDSLASEAQIGGRFTFDGLDAVAEVHRATPRCRIVVTGDDLSDDVAGEAVRRGASAILIRPFGASELRTSFGFDGAPDDDEAILHVPTIDEFVTSDALLPAFQPIVDLADATRRGVGFESLARYRQENLVFCDPAFMFEYARLCGRTAELDLACLRKTLQAARHLPGGKIFINVHPRLVAGGERFARTLVDAARTNDIPLDRLVLEITEQEKLELTETTLPAIEELRSIGVQFALDDVGMSYSHLDLIAGIRPAYMKISHEFGTDFEKDPARRKIIRNIQALAHDFECEVIVEGVESEETSRAAADIGARYGQGFFYSRPADAERMAG